MSEEPLTWLLSGGWLSVGMLTVMHDPRLAALVLRNISWPPPQPLASLQVIVVGDLNVAAERRDVHDAINWDKLYHPAELTALHSLMDPAGSNCADAWRHFHTDTEGVYTVWNEKRSSRAFNVVSQQQEGPGHGACLCMPGACLWCGEQQQGAMCWCGRCWHMPIPGCMWLCIVSGCA